MCRPIGVAPGQATVAAADLEDAASVEVVLLGIDADRHLFMVRAFEEARSLLRPQGTIIDIHPVPGTAEVEVQRAGEVVFAE